MSDSISFASDINDLKKKLKEAKKELKNLQSREGKQLSQIQSTREALAHLQKTAVDNKPLTKQERTSVSRTGLTALSLNTESGRPSRGKRREQIEQAVKKVGRGGRVFKTIELLRSLEEVEGDLSAGVRSYTYSMLKEFEADGVLEKMGHGKWKKVK